LNVFFSGLAAGDKPKLPEGIPPRFPKKPSIKQEGDDLILECILEANPLPEITWFRKEKVIKEDVRITWECKKGKKNRFLLTLRIKTPSLKDAGMYRCNAFNSYGDSNANIDLKFESKSILDFIINDTPLEKLANKNTIFKTEKCDYNFRGQVSNPMRSPLEDLSHLVQVEWYVLKYC
jgi:hypothetical protein